MFRAVGFDIGDTLLYYADTPLDWSSHYSAALSAIATACRVAPDAQQLAAACDILREYNTRSRPRTNEVAAEDIFSRILTAWLLYPADHLEIAIDSFFTFFQRRMCPYPETFSVLSTLRASGLLIGALTDVPYGMPQRLVDRDLERAHLNDLLHVVITSAMAGVRKPAAGGYHKLADSLGVAPDEMLYVGNEPKDVVGAQQAGVPSALLVRSGTAPDHGQRFTISSLTALLPLVRP